jgi:hypothetical protein
MSVSTGPGLIMATAMPRVFTAMDTLRIYMFRAALLAR